MTAEGSSEVRPKSPDTWASRDLPPLAAALRRVEAGDFSVGQLEAIREELDITPAALLAGINALESADPPCLEVQLAGGWTDERAGGGVRRVRLRTSAPRAGSMALGP